MRKHKPTMLLIMDGLGLRDEDYGNAVKQAHTPILDELLKKYPSTRLNASGQSVGLPEGQMGNSEVGHLNIGAGRTVYQDFSRISNAIEDGSFFENETLLHAINHAKEKGSDLHLIGLVSDGGVHSHIDHLYALIKMAKAKGLNRIYIHALLDGRDTPPRSAIIYLKELEEKTKEIGGSVASICGRYYAMDRDKRWERVEKAYDMLTLANQLHANTVKEAIENAYERGENDEFVKPTSIDSNSVTVKNNDSIIFFNFRPDRARELTRCFVDPDFDGFDRKKVLTNLAYVCMTQYDATLPNVDIAYPPEEISNTFGKYISGLGLNQLRIAETEKYAHVTFFFNGGIEVPYEKEERILIPSPKVATYDLKPEMSAYEVTDAVVSAIDDDIYDVIILNYANPDMVGHSGIMEAAVKAVEAVDTCVGKVADAVLKADGQMLITSDHGNSELMIDEKDGAVTAHSLSPVPLIYVSDNPQKLKEGGALSDIAPTLLDMMNLEKPVEMTGHSLLDK